MSGHVELPPDYRARTPTLADAESATEFFNLCEVSEWGEPDFELDEVVEEWEQLDLAESVVLVETSVGEIAGSMTLQGVRGLTFEAFGYVHPEHQGLGVGTWITDWSEQQAKKRHNASPEGYRVVLLNWIATINPAASALMNARGYRAAKVFRRMRIELQEEPAPVTWPAGFDVREVDETRDEHGIFAVIQTAFAENWSTAPRTFDAWEKATKKGDYDTALWVQVFHGDDRAAVGVGRQFTDFGWISWVAVLPEFRRRRLGESILFHLLGVFWKRGVRAIDLGVDSENRHGALGLYQRAGMRESHSYEAHEKALREGKEWRDDEF